jgi:hypothetical protein
MPKPHTFPTLYDDYKSIDIYFLSKHGYLKPNQTKHGTITWSRNGTQTASISIYVSTDLENPFIVLDYRCNGEAINYKIELEYQPSNIGKGYVWFFRCPQTWKRCRKLHLIDKYFFHRSVYAGMYETQIQSKKSRFVVRLFDYSVKSDLAISQIHSKHFRKYYKGKPTKKYLRCLQLIEKGKNISVEELFCI